MMVVKGAPSRHGPSRGRPDEGYDFECSAGVPPPGEEGRGTSNPVGEGRDTRGTSTLGGADVRLLRAVEVWFEHGERTPPRFCGDPGEPGCRSSNRSFRCGQTRTS